MIDLDLYVSLVYQGCSYGEVSRYDNNRVYIKARTWAPGIWAGSEGMSVMIDNTVYKVVKVSLKKRIVYFDRPVVSTIDPNIYPR